jgi:hypothetical protein
MIDLGGELRKAREEKGFSLAEAEKATRIKASYLKALEVNDWAVLPTDVQARGFLRNYAVFLGLDPDDVMSRFSQVARSGGVSFPSPPARGSPVPTTGEDGAVFRPRDINIDSVGGLPGWLSSDIVLGVVRTKNRPIRRLDLQLRPWSQISHRNQVRPPPHHRAMRSFLPSHPHLMRVLGASR